MCGYTHIRRFFYLAFILFAGLSASAQNTRDEIEIDYSRPQQYILGGVGVEGNNHVNENQLISLTGLHPGMKLTIPGDDVSSIVKRLWAQRYFEDVAVVVDRISAARDTAWLKIVVKERPRVSRWTYTGVKSGEKKDLQERLNLRPGREFSEYVRTTSEDIIKRYYKEKGYQLVDVETQVKKDSVIRSAIRVNFDVRRGKKIRVKRINFIGKNDDVSDYKLSKSMKETHSARWYNFFKSKKFKEKEYQTDRKTVLEAIPSILQRSWTISFRSRKATYMMS